MIFLIIGNYFSKVFAGYFRLNVEQVNTSEHFNFLKSHFEIVKPSSGDNFPTIIMFHACGGPYPYLDSWQKFFSDNGIASIQVDSAGPRGMSRGTAIRTVCSGVDLQGQERAGDVYSVLANLGQFNWIDNDNLFLFGWSHGAYTLMDFMTMTDELVPSNILDFEQKKIPKIKGNVTFYPHCGILNLSQKYEWRTKTPLLVFLADQDGFGLATQPSDCIELFETMNKKEKHIDFYLMENSTHVFDSEFYIRKGIVYNKEATDFAKNKIISFIKSSGSKDN
ncbi:MAG: alpha/beta hydrolase family protein [Candidatus Pelagibacterales bacterium]